MTTLEQFTVSIRMPSCPSVAGLSWTAVWKKAHLSVIRTGLMSWRFTAQPRQEPKPRPLISEALFAGASTNNTAATLPIYRDTSMQTTQTSGPKVYKYYLPWAIWFSGVLGPQGILLRCSPGSPEILSSPPTPQAPFMQSPGCCSVSHDRPWTVMPWRTSLVLRASEERLDDVGSYLGQDCRARRA